MDVFAKEVVQREYTQHSAVHETNQYVSVFKKYLLALDWDYDLARLYSFDSWLERDF